MIFNLNNTMAFPPPALAEPDGLLAFGGDLQIKRLLLAYSSGIFPWYNQGDPILWWSPDPRPVFFPGQIKISKSLRSVLRKEVFSFTVNKAFEQVIEACANTPRHGETATWLSSEMMDAYIKLHRLGYAHSIEAWKEDMLAGGLYGVSLGKAFFGESMFFRLSNASKAAFWYLSEFLKIHRFHFIDGQVTNDHLLSLGAVEIPRDEYLKRLKKALEYTVRPEIWK